MQQAAPVEFVSADTVGSDKPKIEYLHVLSGTLPQQTAQVRIVIAGVQHSAEAASVKGPLDAIAKAIALIVPNEAVLTNFSAKALTRGTDAIAKVSVTVEIGGKKIVCRSEHADTNLAFARAYLGAVNHNRASAWKVPRSKR